MRRFYLLLPFAFLPVLAWCFLLTVPQGRSLSSPTGTETQVGSLVIAEPLRFGNLTVFPITSKALKNQDRFVTLDEGLKAGTVEIFEVGADGNRIENAQNQSIETRLENLMQQIANGQPGAGAEVNRLMVVNRSGKPLYLMPGEIIVGGQQDRSIAQETVIAASEKPVPIDVYCVEQGRWSGRGGGEGVTMSVAHYLARDASLDEATISSLSKAADRGKFVVSTISLNKGARFAAQAGKGQEEIWKEVARANTSLKVSTMSGAFTQNYVDANVRKQLQPYIDKLRKPISERRKIVGVIVAINGKIQAVDVFESTPLFRKLWPKLLKSYALDAVAAADDSKAKKLCTVAAAKAFLEACPTASVENRTRTTGGLIVTKRVSNSGTVSFSFGGGGFGGSVHSSAFSKQ